MIDIEKKLLQLDVPQEEIDRRLAEWKAPAPKFTKGWLGLYCKVAKSAAEGAVIDMDKF